MNVEIKYILICLNLILLNFGTNCNDVRFEEEEERRSLRIKRQYGYVYDIPTVSFDLPTATSIATTQAPTFDRMQMYYAYPVPASGTADSVSVGQQNTGTSGSSSVMTSAADGYNYDVQNTQISGSQTNTEAQNTVSSGYQSTSVTGTQIVGNTGSAGYSAGRPTPAFNAGATSGTVVSTGSAGYSGVSTGTVASTGSAGYSADRPTPVFNTGATSGTVVSTGSTGYSADRPSQTFNTRTSAGYSADRPSKTFNTRTGSVSTSAPRYLPPQSSGGNAVTMQTSDSYIPPSVQVSSPQNTQTVMVTQTGTQTSSANGASPSTGYLVPGPDPQPVPMMTQSRTPTQRYLPPQTSGGNAVGVSVTTNNQVQTGSSVTQTSDTYIPPSVQVSSTQTGTRTTSTNVASPSTSYLEPGPDRQQVSMVTQSRTSQPVPSQQYLPQPETPVAVPASTYLPPLF